MSTSVNIDEGSPAWHELYDHVVTDDTCQRFEISFDLPRSQMQLRVDGGEWTKPLSMLAQAVSA